VKLQEALKDANAKREKARSELIKMTQKQVDLPPAQATEQIANSQCNEVEYALLKMLKKEFEVVYKHLMKLMMTSQTTKVSGAQGKMAYLLDTEEFS
jgi:hypothetical protein